MVKRAAGPSDAVIGLGRVRGTTRHLDITLQLAPGGAPPTPEPTPAPEEEPEPPISSEERWQQVLEKLDDIIAVLEKRIG
jgi:hypothetical protein